MGVLITPFDYVSSTVSLLQCQNEINDVHSELFLQQDAGTYNTQGRAMYLVVASRVGILILFRSRQITFVPLAHGNNVNIFGMVWWRTQTLHFRLLITNTYQIKSFFFQKE